jgi:tyrosine-protein phosphatase SIW14
MERCTPVSKSDTAGDTKITPRVVLALAMAFALQTGALAEPSQIPESEADCSADISSSKLMAGQIANFDVVSKGVWRGAAPSPQGLESLAQSGVKTIIDLRLTGLGTIDEESRARELGLKYVHIPLGYRGPSLPKLAQFMKVVNNPANQPVFVHCRYGADRTGTLIGCFRVLHDHWTFSQAYSEMRSHHFKPWFTEMRKVVARVDGDPGARKAIKSLTEQNHDMTSEKQVAAKATTRS